MSALGSRALGAVLWRPTARPAAVPSRRGLLIEAKQPEKQPPRRKGGDPGQVSGGQAGGRWPSAFCDGDGCPTAGLWIETGQADSMPTPHLPCHS